MALKIDGNGRVHAEKSGMPVEVKYPYGTIPSVQIEYTEETHMPPTDGDQAEFDRVIVETVPIDQLPHHFDATNLDENEIEKRRRENYEKYFRFAIKLAVNSSIRDDLLPMKDRIQYALLQLWHMAGNIDSSQNPMPYIDSSIRNMFKHVLRDNVPMIRAGRTVFDSFSLIQVASQRLNLPLTHENIKALAAQSGMDEGLVREMIYYHEHVRFPLSLHYGGDDEEVHAEKGNGLSRHVMPSFEDEVVRRVQVGELLSKIEDPIWLKIVDLRFGLTDGVSHTQSEIAEIVGYSQVHVSRILKKVLDQLRKIALGVDDSGDEETVQVDHLRDAEDTFIADGT